MADFMGMMKQAAQLQSKMQELQAELDRIEVEGTAGGGMVSVRLSAKGDLKGVKIDESLYKPARGEREGDAARARRAGRRRIGLSRRGHAVGGDQAADAVLGFARLQPLEMAVPLQPGQQY